MADRGILLLHFFPSFSFGGQQRRLATLIEALGPAYSHLVYSLDGDLCAKALIEGGAANVTVEPFAIEKSGGLSLRNIGKMRRAIAASGADILCTYNFGAIEAALSNRLGPDIPHIHHEDGFGPDEAGDAQKWRRVLARRVILARSITVVPSECLERMAIERWKLSPARVRRIPVGIDVARFRKRVERRDGPVFVGSIGALRAEKNFARLIRCFDASSRGRDARLVIYGDGPERENLAKLAAAMKGAYAISLPGATASAADALSTIDIFALSSDTEQMPTSLIEAMAAGLPTVATDVGDVKAMVSGPARDFVVTSDDEEAFSARLRMLIDDGALRHKIGAANGKRAENFDRSGMIDSFKRLYSEALDAAA